MTRDVTVVIPVYDRPHLAEEAIASALAQEPRPDVVVVDDHGARPFTDQTMAWAADGLIRIVGDRNLGLPAARNLGARQVTTPYMLFLDDDDRLRPRALAALRAALESAPHAVAAGGGRRRFDDVAVEEGVHWPPDLRAGIAEAVAVCPFSTPGQVLLRRAAFEAIGGFVETEPLAEDWDLWIRLLTVGPILTPAIHAVDYRRHAASLSATTRVAHQAIHMCAHYGRHPPSPEVAANLDRMVASIVDTYLAKVIWRAGGHARTGQWRAAWREFAMASRLVALATRSRRGRTALAHARRGFRDSTVHQANPFGGP